tara:strand:+ start:660 stop:1880 length:1221 start_codon:yes stop_codon:yes gene_type:complete
MIKKFFFYFTVLFPILLCAQENQFKNYVDTLTSLSFFGRGYVNDGHLHAAKYIKKEFENLGLKPVYGSYEQFYPINVNTFPQECVVQFCDSNLKPGFDFIVHPSSGSSIGNFKVIPFHIGDRITDVFEDNGIYYLDVSEVIDIDSLSLYNQLKLTLANVSPVIWYSENKLTWSVSNQEYKFPIIQINKEIGGCDEVFLNIENEFKSNLITQNVFGKIQGRRKKSLVITAHYDHLGMMGSTLFPGANDNASGVSLLLNLAKYYSVKKNKYSVVFICFGAEEIGLLGSKYFVDNPVLDLNKIKFLLNLDLVGTGEEGIAIVNAKNQKKYIKRITRINNKQNLFEKVKLRGQSPNSDHYWFGQHMVPSIFVYTLGGVAHYHDPLDRSETLVFTKTEQLMKLVVNFFQTF